MIVHSSWMVAGAPIRDNAHSSVGDKTILTLRSKSHPIINDPIAASTRTRRPADVNDDTLAITETLWLKCSIIKASLEVIDIRSIRINEPHLGISVLSPGEIM